MKVIVFDLVGVLIKEISFDLTEVQDKMERLFGKNKSDIEYKEFVKNNISSEIDIEKNIRYIIDNIYEVRFPDLLKDIKSKIPTISIVIATNHVSYIKEYIKNNFAMNLIDKIYISAEINKIKPDYDFYQYILNDLNINSKEMLFLDDNVENIEGAKKLGINTIKVNSDTNILDEIISYIK